MPMRHADSGNQQPSDRAQQRIAARAAFQQAVNAGNEEAFAQAFEQICNLAAEDVRHEYRQEIEGLRQTIETMEQSFDQQVLMNRGVRQLTSEEREFYQAFGKAAAAANPKQALANLDKVMPKTVLDNVFRDLSTNHPLLSKINFINAGYVTEFMVNENGYQKAVWGELCDEIVKELTSGFKVHPTNLFMLSAFLPLCKSMLDLGPEWLDNYVRTVLYEAQSNGWEAGIVGGSGKGQPIGMDKIVGDDAVVNGDGYAAKEAIAITDLGPVTMGDLLARISVSPKGVSRPVQRPIMVVNYTDYFQKVFPATTLMASDGTFRRDVLPFPVDIVPSAGLEQQGKARFGDASRYLALAGSPKDGNIDYSDHAQYLQNRRIYVIRGYGNGMPMDNNAFLNLDISGLKPIVWKVELVEQPS